MRDWARIPPELLNLVYENLELISDCIRFSSVCIPWRSMALEDLSSQFPLLLSSTKDGGEVKRSLYRVTNKRVYQFQSSITYNGRYCGSSHGWLFFVNKSRVISLLNPFSGRSLPLPPVIPFYDEKPVFESDRDSSYFYFNASEYYGCENDADNDSAFECEDEEEHEREFRNSYLDEHGDYREFRDGESFNHDYTVYKGILSKDPDLYPNDYVVMIIYGNLDRLAFIRSGDKEWTYLHPSLIVIDDVINFRDKFLAVRCFGELWECDVDCSPPKVTKIFPPKSHKIGRCYTSECLKTYIAELQNREIVIVFRLLDDSTGMTFDCMVLKLENSEWVETKNLDGASLFLGDNHSMSILASKFSGCKVNCIYFTDDYPPFPMLGVPYGHHNNGGIPCDNCVYNLEVGSVSKYYEVQKFDEEVAPPIWILRREEEFKLVQ